MKLWVWAGVAIAVLFLLFKFRNGAIAQANFGAQVSPGGWGSGMIYGPGSSGAAYPYGIPPGFTQPSSFAFGGQTPVAVSGNANIPWYAYLLNAPIDVSYQNGGFGVGYGN